MESAAIWEMIPQEPTFIQSGNKVMIKFIQNIPISRQIVAHVTVKFMVYPLKSQ